MEKIYSTAKVPDYKDKSKKVSLEPEITLTMGKSRDPDELEYYWTQHRESTGTKMREMLPPTSPSWPATAQTPGGSA